MAEKKSRSPADQARLDRDHEFRMGILDLLKTDPTWFYKFILMGGSIAALAGSLGMGDDREGEAKSLILPDGLRLPGFSEVLFEGGITATVWAGMMLTVPVLFGDNGIQLEVEGSAGAFGLGGSGSFKLG